jgi:hypothetical protein
MDPGIFMFGENVVMKNALFVKFVRNTPRIVKDGLSRTFCSEVSELASHVAADVWTLHVLVLGGKSERKFVAVQAPGNTPVAPELWRYRM